MQHLSPCLHGPACEIVQGTILAFFADATEEREGIKRKKDQRKRENFATLYLNPSPTDLIRRLLPSTSESPQLQQ